MYDILGGRATMKAFSTFTGAALFIQALLGGFILAGGNPLNLIVPAMVFILLFAPLGSIVMAYGFDGVWHTIKSLRNFFATPSQTESLPPWITVLKALIIATYAVSVAAFFIGIVVTMGHIDVTPENLAWHFNACMVPFIWAVIFSEGLYRPLKHRLEALVSASTALTELAAKSEHSSREA